MQITRGQRGEDVKDLQKKLRDAGVFNYGLDTGFVGKQTEQAIKDYQKMRGIKVDGIYGDRTRDMLNNEQALRELLKSPKIQGTEHLSFLKEMYRNGHHGINLMAKGMSVSPDDIDQHTEELERKSQKRYPQE